MDEDLPYIGQIALVPYDFIPEGWMPCDGRQLNKAEHEALFTLLGTTYGGDGITKFALPDMRGCAPIHVGDGFRLGQKGGAHEVTLTNTNLPAHTHPIASVQVKASTQDGNTHDPTNAYFANSVSKDIEGRRGEDLNYYSENAPGKLMAANLIDNMTTAAGAGQPHTNMQPYLVMNYIIAVKGFYPG